MASSRQLSGNNYQSPKSDNQASKDFLWLHLRDLPYFRAMLRAVEASYYQDFELPPPVLDVGAGDGHFAELTFDTPLDLGLDPSASLLREARSRGGYKHVVQADGGLMPLPSAHFGSAISNSVLEHIPQIDAVLVETARVLQPGAPFLFCVPNPGYLSELSVPSLLKKVGLSHLGEAYREWFRRMSRVHHADPRETWEARLKSAGLHLEDCWHYFPPVSLRALEWGHYFGLPSLVAHFITGRWILAPTRWNLFLTERYARKHALSDHLPNGTFTFYVARKT